MSLLGAIGGVVGGLLGKKKAGGGAPPAAPSIPYMDLQIPQYDQYSGVLQDPMTAALFSQYMGDMGYGVNYDTAARDQQLADLQAKIDAVGGNYANPFTERAAAPGRALSGFGGRQNPRNVTAADMAEYNRLINDYGLQEFMPKRTRSIGMQMFGGRQDIGTLYNDLQNAINQKIAAEKAGLQQAYNELKTADIAPTVTPIEGFDPNADLRQFATAGAGSIADLYRKNYEKTAQNMRGEAARRGMYRSGTHVGEQYDLAGQMADAEAQAQMNYGLQINQLAEQRRAAQLARIQSLLSNQQAQQGAAYSGEAGARAQAGQYARGNYSDQLAAYNAQQQARERAMGEFSAVASAFGNALGSIGNKPRSSSSGGESGLDTNFDGIVD